MTRDKRIIFEAKGLEKFAHRPAAAAANVFPFILLGVERIIAGWGGAAVEDERRLNYRDSDSPLLR